MLGTILLVILILLLIGALPNWGHSRNRGYGPIWRTWPCCADYHYPAAVGRI